MLKPMQIIHSVQALREALQSHSDIAFVPTMGNLHAGHLHLVKLAQTHAACVVVSIFVNPLQFGANEDLTNYPRTLEADCDKLEQLGVDIVFAPTVNELYPDFDGLALNQTITVQPPPIANMLCGASRPGHFMGVATVVLKLFNIVQPIVAVFGQKDFQQLFIIQAMVRQLNLPITIIAGETMREPNGLAMSSRNGYLSFTEKAQAVQLVRALNEVVASVQQGHHDYEKLALHAAQQLTEQGWQVDYVTVRSAFTLLPPTGSETELVVLGAAKLGKTRLIDNIQFCAKPLK
jgi:pantoate--beta-alanine ligase